MDFNDCVSKGKLTTFIIVVYMKMMLMLVLDSLVVC